MARTFSAIVAAGDADKALGLLAERGVPAWVAGEITPGSGQARLVEAHR